MRKEMTMTTIDYTQMQGLMPKGLVKGSAEHNVSLTNARRVVWQTLLASQVAQGDQGEFMSYRNREEYESLLRLAGYKDTDKWDCIVRVMFGEPLPKGYWEPRMGAIRVILNWADGNYDNACEAIASGRLQDYENYRRKNAEATHADAMEFVRTAHFHEYTVTESGTRNAILGTHDLTFTHTCSCGDSYETRSVNNWSGD
jgi:crotonobetainyl-CoA:carnitine CoA-transferase CaiB-like acyl-CoA transferase